MTTGQLVGWLIYIGAVVGFGVGLALLGALQYRLAARATPEVRLSAALSVIGVGALLSVALLSRDLNETRLDRSQIVLYDDYASGFAASRWFNLLLLATAFVETIRGWIAARPSGRGDPALPLLVCMLAYYVGTPLIQAVGSEHTAFSYKSLYLPVLLAAVHSMRLQSLGLVLRVAKLVVLMLTAGSLLAMLVRPDFVLHRPDVGMIPGIEWRLFGLTEHANTLGPMALLAIVLELAIPYSNRTLRCANLGIAMVVFVFAQSRTTWIAALLIACLVLVPMSMLPRRTPGHDGFRRAVWTLVGCIASAIAVTFVMTLMHGSDYLETKTDLGTLNGRFRIWEITLSAWRENVLFGYGPEVWGPERRLQYNMFHVGQAHNQLLQTLGEAGLAGLALLLAYLAALLAVALRHFRASNGLILALFVLMLTRCVTEAPMRSEGMLSWSMFLNALVFMLAIHHVRLAAVERRPAPAWRPSPVKVPGVSRARADQHILAGMARPGWR